MDKAIKKISPVAAIVIFITFTAYFYLLVLFLMPFLKANFVLNPALYWFITGYFLFIPLFVFAIMMCIEEGFLSIKDIAYALRVKPLTTTDCKSAVISTLLIFFLTGIIILCSNLLNRYYGIRPLDTTPWFMSFEPFSGIERLLLLVWLPMFTFNILGEEMLWRGYIQSRLGDGKKYNWLLVSLLWLIFHLPFGFDLLIMLLPVVIILPYAVYKTKNTTVGIFIHGVYNGPIFILVALGVIK